MNFAPLNVYSSYSFLNSALTIDKIVKATKKFGYSGISLADLSTLTGSFELVDTCQKYNLKYIIGETLYFDDYKFSFFVKDEKGYRNLLRLSNYQNELSINDIHQYFDGLNVVISTDNEKFKDNFVNHYLDFVRYLANITKGYDIYLGLDSLDEKYNQKIREFAHKHTYLPLAFPLIKYLNKEDAIVLSIVNAIKDDKKLDHKKEDGPYYLLNEDEIKHLYTEEEINNTIKIIDTNKFELKYKRGNLPTFVNPSYKDSDTYIKELCLSELSRKVDNLTKEYLDRLNYELDVISSMGYSDYFLIVRDYINYAKEKGILVGPGRGSAAGSLVSYALGIIKTDPLKYDLMFERFLNKERKTMPDIDIDFMDVRRNEIVDYLKEKYGKDCIANIVTIQTIGAKQSLRDVGRVFDIPNNTIDLLSKSIVDQKLTLRENYKTNDAFKKLVDSDNYYLDIVKYASKIEGLARQKGLHASGVVSNKDSLFDIVPVIKEGDTLVVGYEMNNLEVQGLLKMDLLGLRNLTVIDNCLNLINKNYNKSLLYKDIPYEDKNAIKLISTGKTMGVFQLESAGMRKSIKQVGVDCFSDVIALISLFRPGPMKFIPNYGRRKAGKEKINYASNDLKEILSSTYGIIIYQEQIMQIAQKIASFSLGEADLFRRAISKKDQKKMLELENKFITGALKNHYSKETAKRIFDLIDRFANYGFNKAHALSYAVLASQMSYLKYYYPKEFYASILENSSAHDETKLADIIYELKSLKVNLIGPNINLSEERFISNNDGLIFSLTSIKGISQDVSLKILKERNKNGLYKSFEDFIIRETKEGVNLSEKQLQSLIDGGCFDLFNSNRKELRTNLIPLMNYAKLLSEVNLELFNDTSFIPKPNFITVTKDIEFDLTNEYEALGIIISGSLLEGKKDILSKYKTTLIKDIDIGTSTYVAGKIINIKKITTKKDKKPMAFIKIIDDTGQLEVTIFNKLYSEIATNLKGNKTILVKGKISKEDDELDFSMVADELLFI